jgi:autotransporter-associated beta strand protein
MFNRVFASALIAAIFIINSTARGQFWTGNVSTDWNTAGNWSPATVPNSPTATVTFGFGASNNQPNISASVQAQSLSFQIQSGGYTLTSSASPPQTLSSLTAINVGSSVTGTQAINLASLATGSLLFASGGPLTINNASTSTATTLVIGPNTVIGTPGAGGVVVNGVGTTRISGSFASNTNVVNGGVAMSGLGKLILSGDGSALGGGLTLNAGTLQLDYSANTASKLGGGALTLNAGILSAVANTTTAVTQTIPGGTVIAQNQSDIIGSSAGGGTLTLALGAITRSGLGTVDISTGSGSPTFTATTSTGNTNGLLGVGPAFVTLGGGATWASVSGGTVTGATYAGNTFAPGVNTDALTFSAPVSFTTNSIRFNTGVQTLTMSGTNTLQSGGILVTPNAAGGDTMTGGALTVPGSGELIIHQYSSGPFTIASDLTGVGSLTKTGPGTLALGGNNTGVTGPININRGSLTVTNTASVNSASSINFNDARGGVQTTLAVDLGTSATGTIGTPIQLSAIPGNGNYGTYISTGGSLYSHVTIGGAISSASGSTTPLYVGDSSNTNEIDLTGANTFTGNVFLGLGLIGITSSASLGNAANAVTFSNGSTVNGGLLFLTGGVTIARSINETGPGRIVVTGTNVDTISGPITGSGGVTKDGTGTLVLSGSSSVSGTLTVTAGTLSLGAAGFIGGSSPNPVTVASGAIFSPATAPTVANTFGTVTLNGGTFLVPGGTGQTYTVTQFVVNSPGGTVDFSAAGVDTLKLASTGSGYTNPINANSTWLAASNGSSMTTPVIGTVSFTIAPGVTLTNGLGLIGPNQTFQVLGGGTLYQNSVSTSGASVTASVKVTNGTYRVTDASSAGGVGNLGTGTFTLDGGTFDYGGGTSATTSKPIALTTNGGTIEVESASATLIDTGAITGSGALTKTGFGTLALTNTGNSFTSMTISAGAVQIASDSVLGTGPLTINAAGTLSYGSSTTTSRNYNLVSGAIGVAAGQTLTLSGGSIGGGFVVGPGTLALSGGSTLGGTTTAASLVISVTGSAGFFHVTNGATMNLAAGLPTPITFSLLTNEGSGSITVGQDSQLNVADFQSYGTLTLNPGSYNSNTNTGNVTLLTNTGSSPLYFNGGSRTFVSTVAQALNQNAGIDLNGKDAIVAGGLFVNNGFVYDSTGTNHRVIADYGATVKGAGFWQPLPKTQNGGTFIAGNSPGKALTGSAALGGPFDPSSSISDYTWQINDAGPSATFPAATGTAGPAPNAATQVSGWGLLQSVARTVPPKSNGNLQWDATPADRFTIHVQTLAAPNDANGNPSAAGGYEPTGDSTPGLMTDFDPTQTYTWKLVGYQGSYIGPTDTATLDASTVIDTSGFLNPHPGRFDLVIDQTNQELDLVYTPTAVPEPGTLLLCCLASGVGLLKARHGRRRERASARIS